MRTWKYPAGLLLLLVMALLLYVAWSFFSIPTYVFLVPKNYHGWVQVYMDIPDAKEPPKEFWNKYMINVPPNGMVYTPLPDQPAHLETYFVDQHGHRTELLLKEDPRAKDPNALYVQDFFTQGLDHLPACDVLFIGTSQEYEKVLRENRYPDYSEEIKKKFHYPY
ncbi:MULTISPECIES: hypothetical protein [Thermoactinomyces]|uniref:DUF6843 domain-containing protein n=1 Tax=Thermoactinomyces daqus TaxID=1329516 RepID=A0A7W1XCG0_9BACL|nr:MULTISPECIES: hypothetical protein [Thermoactinomyces]MBA4544115.1 hypothetical protein [Thermoactinomyces daqus]MBH8599352.1 hypothetical protein [Thermoactinomyces sp. CICC 10523]MBH8605292.1 hypothetical protein [Thermoactinomyces sp. CICC 10522]MBH8608203.1 hypothetical protein [Thermoactinomyces sp. CICC 10521]